MALLSLCAGGFCAWIWWAATISTKLDSIMTQQSALVAASTVMRSDLEDLKAWRKLIDAAGSPRLQSIEKEIEALRRDLDTHKAKDGRP